jgi:hypothetical protein
LKLQALGNAPYAQVFELVEKIHTQAQAQMQNTETENGYYLYLGYRCDGLQASRKRQD